jgi:isochorismate hydrolase
MITKTIIEPVFKTEVLFISNCSIKEANKYLKKIGNKRLIDDDENTAGCLIRDNNNLFRIIWSENIKQKGEVVHEIYHLITRILEDKGIPNVSNIQNGMVGDETGAYLMEFYYNQIFNKLK